MKTLYTSLIFLAIVLLNAQFISGQWVQTNGPGYGWINCLAASGSYIIASEGPHDVYLSTNNGTSWTTANYGLTNTNIRSFAFGGTNIFAGTYGGVFLTTNNGYSWTQANDGLFNDTVNTLIVDGTNLFAGTAGGVFLSTNNGTNWELANSGLTNTTVNAFAVSGSNLFAGTSGGVYLSTDNGTNWAPVNNGLAGNVTSLAISGSNIFAQSGGVYLSTNNGANWTKTSLTRNGDPTNLVVIGSDIFVGYFRPLGNMDVYRSTNNGIDWKRVMGKGAVTAIAASGTNLYASVDDVQDFIISQGIFLSTNNGANWTAVGLPISTVYSLAISGTNIFAGLDYGGLFLSTNNGAIWTQLGFETYSVHAIAVSGNNIYLGTVGLYNSGGIFHSTDNGANWTFINSFNVPRVYALAINGTNIFAGTVAPSNDNHSVMLSTDNGTTWASVSTGLPSSYSVYALAINGTNVFAAGNGVYLSTNNGTNWVQIINGLTNTTVNALTVSGNNIFAGTAGGVYRSTNNGTNWTQVNNGMTNTNVNSFAVSGTNIFAGTNCGMFLSTDYGTLWTQVGPDGYSVLSMVANETNVIAGTGEAGVWYRPISELSLPVELTSFAASGGKGSVVLKWNTATELNNMGFDVERSGNKSDWVKVGFVKGNGNSTVSINYMYEDKTVIQAGKYYYRLKQVDNNGSFKYSSIVEVEFVAPGSYALNQNYPNPFNPSTMISYRLKDKGFVKLRVYGIKGELVKILVNEQKDAGYYESEFDGKGLASGVYIYRIEVIRDGNKSVYSDIKKTVLLK